MEKTRSKKFTLAILTVVMMFVMVLAPAGYADAAEPTGEIAAAVEKTQATVAAKLEEVKAGIGEKIGVDNATLEYLWNYGANIGAGVEGATDDFVAMLEGIGAAYDNGDIEGIMKTPETFINGLKQYLGGIKDVTLPRAPKNG